MNLIPQVVAIFLICTTLRLVQSHRNHHFGKPSHHSLTHAANQQYKYETKYINMQVMMSCGQIFLMTLGKNKN